MRTAITSLVFSLFVFASPESHWVWYPINTVTENHELISGLVFYFENAPDPLASITVWGHRGTEPFKVSATLDTDPTLGGTLFHFDIRNLDTFRVERIRMRMDRRDQIVEKPPQGQYYRF
jgi:hypothetical protein